MPNNILCKSFIKFPLSDKPSPVNKPPLFEAPLLFPNYSSLINDRLY